LPDSSSRTKNNTPPDPGGAEEENMKLKLVKLGNVLVNPAYVAAIHELSEQGRCCISLSSGGDRVWDTIHVNATLEEVAERLGAAIV
jgi:hypothetical protein